MLHILGILKPFGYARRGAAGKWRSRAQQPCVSPLEVRALMAATFQGLGAGTDAAAVSADGSVVVGNAGGPFHWTQDNGVVSLLDSSGNIYDGIATAVSGNGSVIVGDLGLGVADHAWRWTDGVAAPIPQLASAVSSANSVSEDGSIIAGDIVASNTAEYRSGYTLTGATLEIIPRLA
jgi:uncharacterized membrane protein